MPLTFLLGGARSGKSALAVRLASDWEGPVTFLATAEARDDGELAARIARHRLERPRRWRTIEEPLDLVGELGRVPEPVFLVVDCLTLWLGNLMGADHDVNAAIGELLAVLARPAGPVVLVSNEVGFGIVPATPLGRTFRDHAGRLNQAVAANAERVVLVAAGLPLILKDTAPVKVSASVKDPAP